MANKMPVNAAAAGAVGSPYVAKVSSASVATGNYVINETNFPGIGKYIPGWCLIVGVTNTNVTLSVSTDNGTSWVALSGTGGGYVFLDSGNTVRINTAAPANIFLFPMG